MPLRALMGAWLLSLLTAGCATQGAVKKVRVDIGRVEDRLAVMEQQLASMDSLLRVQWTGLSTDNEDLNQRMQQVQARLDEVVHRLAAMSGDLEASRIYGGGRQALTRDTPSTRAPADTTKATQPALVADAQALYDLAFSDMKAENYTMAIAEFAQFLESFPQHELADNASYWQGECYYARKEFAQAARPFERVIKEYPDSDKVPAAMLKLGFSLLEVKERNQAVQYLRDLVKQYPDSQEAALAKERLKNVGPAPRRSGGKGKR